MHHAGTHYTRDIGGPASRRMAGFLSCFPRGGTIGTYGVSAGFLGDLALSLPPNRARHKIERLLDSAEREGFIRRLPSRVVSSSPRARNYGRHMDKELAWQLTPEGERYAEEVADAVASRT